MKRSKAVLWGVLTAAFFLLALSAALLERAGVSLTDQLGGALTGIGTGGWAFCLTHFLTELYFRFRPKARRAQEIGEKDERNRAIRGEAAYRALLNSSAVFLAEWLVLLVLDVPAWIYLLVAAAYLANFGCYLYHVLKLQNRM